MRDGKAERFVVGGGRRCQRFRGRWRRCHGSSQLRCDGRRRQLAEGAVVAGEAAGCVGVRAASQQARARRGAGGAGGKLHRDVVQGRRAVELRAQPGVVPGVEMRPQKCGQRRGRPGVGRCTVRRPRRHEAVRAIGLPQPHVEQGFEARRACTRLAQLLDEALTGAREAQCQQGADDERRGGQRQREHHRQRGRCARGLAPQDWRRRGLRCRPAGPEEPGRKRASHRPPRPRVAQIRTDATDTIHAQDCTDAHASNPWTRRRRDDVGSSWRAICRNPGMPRGATTLRRLHDDVLRHAVALRRAV